MQNKSLIKERISKYLDFKGVSKYQFYKETGLGRGLLDGESGITEMAIAKFIAYAKDCSIDWLVVGKGKMLKNQSSELVVNESPSQYGVIDRKIRVVEHKAMAGFRLTDFSDPEHIEERPYVSISTLPPGDYLAFEVYGDSMEPTFVSRDVIIGERMELQNFSARDDIYILLFEDNLVVKRVHFKKGDEYLILTSDNDYIPSRSESFRKLKAVWKYKPPIIRYKSDSNDDVNTRMSALEKDILEIKRMLNK